MPRLLNRLTDRTINSTKIIPGRHADGGGLYLVVDRPGGKDAAKRWVFLYRKDGRLREMGLGGLLNVPMAKARAEAERWRLVLGDRANRGDPIAERKRASGGVPMFGDFADKFLEAKEAGWRNDKHRAQWRMTLTEYAAALRLKPVNEIATEDVLAVLKPIWTEKPETASRLRGRIERVLDAARAAGHRTGENPARWRGHLDQLLAKRQKLSRGHHAAMPYDEVPAFMAALGERPATAARALEFTILTAARSGEALAARWDEIDFDAKLWTIPAGRMKAAREHRVPLSDRVVAILREMEAGRTGEYVFPGQRARRPLSNMAFEMLLRRIDSPYTAHGFRSSFRDWAGDRTTFPREVAEAALAHAIANETEAAYRRSDALEKRRKLMDAWAAFLEAKPARVIALRSGAA